MAEESRRYEKPRILLVDLPEDAALTLRKLGLNVETGSFGVPYEVKLTTGDILVPLRYSLPGYAEQEIIVVDTSEPTPVSYPNDVKPLAPNVPKLVVNGGYGIINPRYWAMGTAREEGARILESGGMFIVFATPRTTVEYVFLRPEERYKRREEFPLDNWSFLSLLGDRWLTLNRDSGTEMKPGDQSTSIISLIDRFTKGSYFSCTIRKEWRTTEDKPYPAFTPFLFSKYGDAVGAAIYLGENRGSIIILPQIEDKAGFLSDLFKSYLPEVFPRLFPEHEGEAWVHRRDYEHPGIVTKRSRQAKIQLKADEAKNSIEVEILEEKTRLAFLHGLLTKTGDELVDDVKSALEFIEFQNVIDVDKTGEGGNKQEDLQILDRPTKVLVEVKGLGGLPREANTLQVTKFILRRIRNWIWPDQPVITPHGVTLVNHQRNLPPLERDNNSVFTDAQVADASDNGTGLMTTWDLFRLIRGMERWGWDKQHVQDVFFQAGRIGELPAHYRRVGEIAHYYDKISVASILVDDGERLSIGDTVGYVFEDRFHEEKVESLRVDKVDVREATSGQKAGYKTGLVRKDLPEGTAVDRATSGLDRQI
ncbi:hypothetical protein TA3x_005225 [Tundrisphaera sp. TA3]|uniref:hypothetical protein n=1 Tax=Tundrisphaera sp. TA3 TaxID=3435775 RepID=UPI003EBA1439